MASFQHSSKRDLNRKWTHWITCLCVTPMIPTSSIVLDRVHRDMAVSSEYCDFEVNKHYESLKIKANVKRNDTRLQKNGNPFVQEPKLHKSINLSACCPIKLFRRTSRIKRFFQLFVPDRWLDRKHFRQPYLENKLSVLMGDESEGEDEKNRKIRLGELKLFMHRHKQWMFTDLAIFTVVNQLRAGSIEEAKIIFQYFPKLIPKIKCYTPLVLIIAETLERLRFSENKVAPALSILEQLAKIDKSLFQQPDWTKKTGLMWLNTWHKSSTGSTQTQIFQLLAALQNICESKD